MDPQPVVEKKRSQKLSVEAKVNKKKIKKLNIVERILLEDDGFTLPNSSDNFAEDCMSRDSMKNQTRPDSQTVESTCDSCYSNGNTNLTENSSGYCADNTVSSITSSCVSFATKNCSGKNPKKTRADRKKKLQNVVLQALGDSFNLDVEIPEKSENSKQQPAILDHEPTQNGTETKARTTDTFKISNSKMRSAIKEKIVSAEDTSAFCSEETDSNDAPSTSNAKEVETFPLNPVKRTVKYVLMQDALVQTDSIDSSAGNSCMNFSVQVELCNCPKLVGFHCTTNVSTFGQENLPDSQRNCEKFNHRYKSFSSVDQVGGSKSTVPSLADCIFNTTEAMKTVVPHSTDVTKSSVEVNDNDVCSVEDASSDDALSQMLLRIGLSDDLRNLPDESNTLLKMNSVDDRLVCAVPEQNKEKLLKTDERNLDNSDSVNTADDSLIHEERTESKALDRSELEEDSVSVEQVNISLQVSLSSDGIPDENLIEEIAAATSGDALNLSNESGDALNLSNESGDALNLSNESGDALNLSNESVVLAARDESNETFVYDVPDLKTAEESLMPDEQDRRESATCTNESLMCDIRTEAAEVDVSESANGLQDSLIHNPKTDFRNISLQVSFSSDEMSDESDAANCSESVLANPEKSDELLEHEENTSVLKDHDDFFVPESSHLSEVHSASSAVQDGELIEEARYKRRLAVPVDTPSEASLAHSLHNVSLQVSLSSDESSDAHVDDLETAEDCDQNDRDRKDGVSSPSEPSSHQKPSVHRSLRNSDYVKHLFNLSDEEQSAVLLPDDDDLADRIGHRLSEVQGKLMSSTFLRRPSSESLPRAAGNWILSPVGTEDFSRDHFKLKAGRRMRSEEESTSDSYKSANRASLTVPDTSESDDDQDIIYKTAYVDYGDVDDGEEEFVAESSGSQLHENSGMRVGTTQVINVSDSSSSEDGFEKFVERVKTTEKRRKPSPSPSKDFVVDDSEEEEEEREEEEEACDVISDDDGDDARILYYQLDNEREENNIDMLSNRLSKVLDFSLTSDSSDDDFENVLPKRTHVPKKSGKLTFHLEQDNAKTTAAVDEEVGIFRTPTPVVSKKRILSDITPKVSSSSTMFDKRQAPYTVGHAPLPRCSFLKSLSADVKDFLRDAKSARYVKNFKSLRNELTAELFALYNREVFNMKLPSDMNVIWNNQLRRTAGFCRSRLTREDPPKRMAQIELSVKVCDSADRLRDTLIHEMCHAVVWTEHGSREVHGPIWKSWARKANCALPDLPPITRCHSYDINTKYIYKCVKCGYEIGRHSKSLDIERKICGHCRGQFELLVRARPGARTDSCPTTPRTPNRFALFVKENYGDIKRAQPGVTHKAIMEMIGARYSAKKTMLGNDQRVELIE